MRGRRKQLVGGAALALTALLSVSATGAASPADSADSVGTSAVTFFDDFSGSNLDRSKWKVLKTGENFGTVNNEQQAYVDSSETIYIDHNVAGASGGTLALHPRYRPGHQAPDGRSYDFISGRVSTQDRFEFTYGRYEARIKLPENANASGLWPAWWSLGAKIDEGEPWPTNGEVDVMENVGEPWTSVALHGPEYHGDTPVNASQSFPNGDPGGWHTYRADWWNGGFTFFVDDRQIYRITKAEIEQNGWTWVYDDPQYMILNFALGGTYPQGVNGVTQPYPGLPQSTVDKVASGSARYLIDWVRVSQ